MNVAVMNSRTRWVAIALLLAIAAVYAQTLSFGFVALDVPHVM